MRTGGTVILLLLGGALVSLGSACGRDNEPVQVTPISTVAATSPNEVAARVPTPTLTPTPTVEPPDETELAALDAFNATFRGIEHARQLIRDEFDIVGVEIQAREFGHIFTVLENVIKRQDWLIKEAEGIAGWSDDTSQLKAYLRFALSEDLAGYETLLHAAKRAQGQDPTGNPAELIKNLTGMHDEAKRRLANADAYFLRIFVLINELQRANVAL